MKDNEVLTDIIGKTIHNVHVHEIEQQYGMNPVITLVFTDQSTWAFTLPRDDE